MLIIDNLLSLSLLLSVFINKSFYNNNKRKRQNVDF